MSIRKNTLINLVGAVVPMGVMLVTVPLYLNLLGEARYGVLALVWLVLGYFSFLEMGLGKATANQIAKAHDAPANARAEIFWTAITLNTVMGVAGAGVLWLVGDYLISSVLKMPDDFRAEAHLALPWMVATFPLALVSSVLNGALEGRNQFFTLNVLQICTNVAFQIVPLFFAWLIEPSLAVVIPVAVLTRGLMNLFYLRTCQRTVPLTGKPTPNRSRVRPLFAYGGWVAITSAIGPLLETIERFIIGIVAGTAAVAHYTVPMQLVGKVKVIPGALSRAMFPVLSSSSESDGIVLAHRALRSLSIAMTVLVLLILLGLRPFLELWIGPTISGIAAPLGEILLIGVWFTSIAHLPYFLLQAQGKPNVVAKVHLVELPIYLGSIWIAMQWAGLPGVAIVWVLRCMVEAIVLLSFAKLFFSSAYLVVPLAMAVGLAVYGVHWSPNIGLDSRIIMGIFLLSVGAFLFRDTIRPHLERFLNAA